MPAMLRGVIISAATFTARHRAVVVAILSVLASAVWGYAMTIGSIGAYHVLGLLLVFFIILAGTVSSRYEAVPTLTLILPVIHKVLQLGPDDRLVIHHIKSVGKRQYEQLTEYYPTQRKTTRGRTFSFSHGIVGQSFTTSSPHHYSIPEGKEFEVAMNERWSFNKEELARLTRDRRSFMAYPIGAEGVYAQAVLYMDSSEGARFADANVARHVDLIEGLFVPQITEALRKL